MAFGEATLAGFGVSPNAPIPQKGLGFCTSERGLEITERGTIPLGSISVHHGWTLHGALPNSSQVVREAVTIIYYADGACVDDPPLPDNPSPYESRAAYTRRKEMGHWLPGLKVGDRAVSRENPLVFDAAYSR